jgi:hypothetical protein
MCVKEEDENESTMDKEMARRMREWTRVGGGVKQLMLFMNKNKEWSFRGTSISLPKRMTWTTCLSSVTVCCFLSTHQGGLHALNFIILVFELLATILRTWWSQSNFWSYIRTLILPIFWMSS